MMSLWWLVSPGNPLKDGAKDMAPLNARLGAAQIMSRRSRIKATAIEQQLGTRYTADTLDKIVSRYSNRQFIWLMGSDNLAIFHKWKDWRKISRTLPIAVIARPGYNEDALAAPAMGWLRRFVRPKSQCLEWTRWSRPALVQLRFRPDSRSATLLRQADPQWYRRFDGRAVRDDVTRHMVI